MSEDQAERLRSLKQQEVRSGARAPNRRSSGGAVRISVTSGKGGVGKSNFALNSAIVLAGLRQRVLLIDADTNLANLDILLGINPHHNLSDVVAGEKQIGEIVVPGPGGIDILPGSSGVVEMLELEHQVQRRLVESFAEMEEGYDCIVIDTGAGMTRDIISYVVSSDQTALVTTPEPTAFADAYAMIKVISRRNPTLPIRLLVNMVSTPQEARETYEGLRLVVNNFLNVPIEFLGYLPRDPNVVAAVARQVPFVLKYPRSPASLALALTARKLLQRRGRAAAEAPESLLERLIDSKGDDGE